MRFKPHGPACLAAKMAEHEAYISAGPHVLQWPAAPEWARHDVYAAIGREPSPAAAGLSLDSDRWPRLASVASQFDGDTATSLLGGQLPIEQLLSQLVRNAVQPDDCALAALVEGEYTVMACLV